MKKRPRSAAARFELWWEKVGCFNGEYAPQFAANEAFLAGRKDAIIEKRPTVVIKHLRYKTTGMTDQFEVLLNGKRIHLCFGNAGGLMAVEYATMFAKALKIKVEKHTIDGSQ